jgi:type IV pilus assembly protein PilA
MKNIVKNNKGFSLVELLVVIAVIGIIAAIAIPAMSSIFGESEDARNKRNAQNIASVANAALAAGVPVGTAATQLDLTNDSTVINSLEAGVTVPAGSPFAGKRFAIGTMDTTAETDVKEFLKTTAGTNGSVEFISAGAHTATDG